VTGNKNGQSNLLYLPLDKMVESGRNTSTSVTGAATTSNEANARAAADLQQQPARTRESR
jgi:membrane protease subunit HflK